MSQVHYKFKSSKDYDSATFDGHSISVFDLKKEILLAKGLKGPDDLQLTHAESGEGNCHLCADRNNKKEQNERCLLLHTPLSPPTNEHRILSVLLQHSLESKETFLITPLISLNFQ